MDICLAGARATASRRNGAKSRGPKTAQGKARSARNALRHGLRAQKFVVVGDECAQEFAALEAALVEELAPEGALQRLLAARIARAGWRLGRADRMEGELLQIHAGAARNLARTLIHDGQNGRAFDTLLRYRGTAMAELWRALRLLKALQAEAVDPVREPEPRRAQADGGTGDAYAALSERPIEPETRGIPGEIVAVPVAEKDQGGATMRHHASFMRRSASSAGGT